jgi:endonuclease-3
VTVPVVRTRLAPAPSPEALTRPVIFTPEATVRVLEARLPERGRVDIARLLVAYNKNVCTSRRSRCPTCPRLDPCARDA